MREWVYKRVYVDNNNDKDRGEWKLMFITGKNCLQTSM